MTAVPAMADGTTVRDAIADAARRLAAAGIDGAPRDARLLVGAALGLDREALLSERDRAVDAPGLAAVDELVARRAAGEPVSRILGRREFWSLDFALGPATLDPRPDSECLVEAVLERFPDPAAAIRVVDLGTGTGCLLLAILSERPKASGIGVDIAPAAVETARENAARLGLGGRARFVVDDWGKALRGGPSGGFDCLLCNPPYIPTGQIDALAPAVRHDPITALDGGPDGLGCYRTVIQSAHRLLKPGGFGFVELGDGQGAEVGALASSVSLRIVGVKNDLSGRERCLIFGRRPSRFIDRNVC